MISRMVNLKQILLTSVLLLCCYASSFAYGKILDIQDDARKVANFDCEVEVTLRVNMAYWTVGQASDLPPMFLQYQFGNDPLETVQINPLDFADYGQTIYGVPIVEWRHPVTIDVEDECNFGISDAIPHTFKLVSASSGGVGQINTYYNFPVGAFVLPEQFFSCEIFDVAFGQESSWPQCFYTQPYAYEPIQTGTIDVDCKFCGGFDFTDSDGSGTIDSNPNNDQITLRSNGKEQVDQAIKIQFAPNPFKDQLSIPFELTKDAVFELNIFDATGKIVHRENSIRQSGAQQIDLSTGHWPPGLYYAQVKTGASVETYRLVKMK